MLRSFKVVVMVVSAVIMTPSTLAAQNKDRPLSELLPQLYSKVIITEFDAFRVALPSFVDPEVLKAAASARFFDVTTPIIQRAGNQLTSFPLPSPSGGFTWTLDTTSGVFTRASNSFGPIFAERPSTIGRHRLNVGANFQHVTFDHLEDRSLRDGQIVSYFSVPILGEHIFFENSLDLAVTADTVNTFATYGVTDRLDVGVAIPINRVDLRAKVTARLGVTPSPPDAERLLEESDSATKSGIGDIVIRAKFNIFSHDKWGVAEAVDVRLPTGDELNLLGIAGPQVKLMFITSSVMGQLSPHANVGYTISGTSKAGADLNTFAFPPFEEINYSAGADLALSLRTTVAADILGRVMRKAGTMTWGPADFDGTQYPQYQQFDFTNNKDLHLLLGSIGAKVNPFKNMLFTANVLFPLTNHGLTDRLTWMAGVDYSF